MREVTEIRHEGLPEDYANIVQAKVHVYKFKVTEIYCFETLRGARDFLVQLCRQYHYKPLITPEDHKNPPDNTYLVWVRSGATI